MLFSLLFLGLVPVAFLSDSFSDMSPDTDEDHDAGRGLEPTPTRDVGDFIATDDVASDDAAVTGALLPNTGDQVVPGASSGSDTDVLTPNTGLGDGPSPHVADTFLDQLLGTETDAHYGREDLASFLGDIDETKLTNGDDDFAMANDGIDGTGCGSIDDFHGTAIVRDDDGMSVDVVDAGDGDDTLTTGDGAAYLFANDGDDTVIAGEGALAAFGGNGEDELDGQASLQTYLDGGKGDDVLLGGDGDDRLFGGVHEKPDDDSSDDDVLSAGAGDDVLNGGFGADILFGGAGDDVINHLGHAMEDSAAERHDFDWHIDGDADVLDGGEGDDTLILDRADTATGGAGDDVFWLYSNDGDGLGHAEVTDFTPGEDFLRIQLDPATDALSMEFDVHPSASGDDSIVTVNGEVVALLKGSPNATVRDVYVEVAQEAWV